MKKLKILISGMHCASCASNIERSLKKVKGIQNITVNPVANKAFIEVDEKVSEDDIIAAISKVGYKVVRIEEEEYG